MKQEGREIFGKRGGCKRTRSVVDLTDDAEDDISNISNVAPPPPKLAKTSAVTQERREIVDLLSDG